MTRVVLVALLPVVLLPLLVSCGSSAVPASDVCAKMIECNPESGTTLAECEQEMAELLSVMRTASWNALAGCLLESTCEQLAEEDGFTRCLEAAMDAAPEDAGDSFIAAYCSRAIECGEFPGSVDDCVELVKQQAGDYLGAFGMFNDKLLGCLEDCTRGLECGELNNFYEICGLACEVPFVEIDLDCENGYQEDDVCICDEGWAGDRCDVCAEGYYPDGWDCVGRCEPDTCSGHGLCDDNYGHLYCTCDTGYAGDRCESCADGYLEVDGRCRPTGGCIADGPPCDDGLVCTTGDTCSQGVCLGTEVDCDDGLVCTVDACLEISGGCHHDPQPTGEPEGYLGDPICANGLDDDCDGLTDDDDDDCRTMPCGNDADCTDDGNPCTISLCDQGLCFWPAVPDATPCPGSSECTTRFICRGTECLPGPPDKDTDGDGFADAQCGYAYDCDDTNPDVHPGAEGPRGSPTCTDLLDNDCDGLSDQWDQSCWELRCTPEGWCLEHPRTGAENLGALLAMASDDVWAAGGTETILHWDGTGWEYVESPTYWAVHDMCGCAPDDIWAVGQTGDVLRWDGVSWEIAPSPNDPHILNAIWCRCDTVPTDDVWAVGRPGIVLHYDGSTWSVAETPSSPDLYGVWSSGPDEAWAVGRDGAILHYSGSVWQTETSPTTEDLRSVWGLGPTEVWAVGAGSTILRYDGIAWSPDTHNLSGSFYDLWGLESGSTAWAVGESYPDGVVIEWSGGTWHATYMFGGSLPALNAIGGTAEDDLWAVGDGGAILHTDGQEAVRLVEPVGRLHGICAYEYPGGEVEAWVVGQSRDDLLLRDGAEWQPSPSSFDDWMVDVWCGGPHGNWAISDDGAWRHWGVSVSERGEVDLPTADYLRAMAGRMVDGHVELWAVGDDGLAVHFDGTDWTVESLYSGWSRLQAVWIEPAPADPAVFAVGESGIVYTRNDAGWMEHESNVGSDLNAVWGDGQGMVWVVGDDGTVLRWNGTVFQQVAIPSESEDLTDIGGTGPDDIWIAARDRVIHWDGDSWVTEPLVNGNDRRLAITQSHLWAVSASGAIHHKER